MLELKRNEPKRKRALKDKVRNTLEKLSGVFEELSFQEITEKVGYSSSLKIEEIRKIIEELLFEGEMNARIKKDIVVFEKPLQVKTVDILMDIKDNTEIIKEYTLKIEEIIDKTEDIEDCLRSRLATDYEKVKDIVHDYKSGKIKKGELAKRILKILGKNVAKILIKRF